MNECRKVMRYLTGSQCSSCSAELMCDRRPHRSSSRVLYTRWRGASVPGGERPARTELQ